MNNEDLQHSFSAYGRNTKITKTLWILKEDIFHLYEKNITMSIIFDK